MTYKLWWKVDEVAHWLHRRHLLPRRVKHWVCDRFDLSLGLTPEEMFYTADDWTSDDTLTERQIRDHMDRENWRRVKPRTDREEGTTR